MLNFLIDLTNIWNDNESGAASSDELDTSTLLGNLFLNVHTRAGGTGARPVGSWRIASPQVRLGSAFASIFFPPRAKHSMRGSGSRATIPVVRREPPLPSGRGPRRGRSDTRHGQAPHHPDVTRAGDSGASWGFVAGDCYSRGRT